MNTTISTSKCKAYLILFQTSDIDILILKGTFVLTILLITIANIYLIKLLKNRKKNSINTLFTILSWFDISFGIVAIPVFLSMATIQKSDCIYYRIAEFTSFFAAEYPWYMVLLIATDRYLIITKQLSTHAKYMNKRKIYLYVFTWTVLTSILSLWYTCTKDISTWVELNVASTTVGTIIFIEFLVIIWLYINIVVYVQKRNKSMQASRHGRKKCSYSIRTAKTVFLVLLCLVCCNLSYAVVSLYVSLCRNPNPKVTRNILGWFSLLSHLNSFLNVLIISHNRNIKHSAPKTTMLMMESVNKVISMSM